MGLSGIISAIFLIVFAICLLDLMIAAVRCLYSIIEKNKLKGRELEIREKELEIEMAKLAKHR